MAFTEKGLEAINNIINQYKEGERFCAKEVNAAGITLSTLSKDGYLIKHNTTPATYSYSEKQRIKIEEDLPKSFAPYSEKEFANQSNMKYAELVNYCKNKYGKVSGPYFCTPEMKSQNPKIKRAKEGLIIHHIAEEKHIMLCNQEFAQQLPFELQQGENLVYCNKIEHLLLHMKIVEEWSENTACLPGIGGVYNFIYPELLVQYMEEKIILGIHEKTLVNFVEAWLKKYKKLPMAKLLSFNEIKKAIPLNVMALKSLKKNSKEPS